MTDEREQGSEERVNSSDEQLQEEAAYHFCLSDFAAFVREVGFIKVFSDLPEETQEEIRGMFE